MGYSVRNRLERLSDDLLEEIDDVFRAYAQVDGVSQESYNAYVEDVFGLDIRLAYTTWLADGDA